MADLPTTTVQKPDFGEAVEGIDTPVFNERTVRAAAGLLFVFGAWGWMTAFFTGDVSVMRAFGFIFFIDMAIRLTVSHRFSPSMALGALAVRWQRPEWVGAAQKKTAWWLGFGIAFIACLGFGWLGFPLIWMLALCGLCLAFLFLEAAFGICVGCELHRVFSKTPPELCPGDRCTYTPPKRGEAHSIQEHSAHDH
jgi:hypothetical protein